MRSGIPIRSPGRHTAYGFGEYVCASADHRGIVGLAPCVEPVPSHQRWSFGPASQQLRVGGLAPAPPGQPADPRSDVASGLCLTRESHTISYLLDTVVTPAKGGGMAARSTSYNITTGSRYCKIDLLYLYDSDPFFLELSDSLRPSATAVLSFFLCR